MWPHLLLTFLTFNRVKEVEERVVGHLFGNSAHSAAAFMLLLLLDRFHCHILPLVPIYLTAEGQTRTKEGDLSESRGAEIEVGRSDKWMHVCGMKVKRVYRQ